MNYHRIMRMISLETRAEKLAAEEGITVLQAIYKLRAIDSYNAQKSHHSPTRIIRDWGFILEDVNA